MHVYTVISTVMYTCVYIHARNAQLCIWYLHILTFFSALWSPKIYRSMCNYDCADTADIHLQMCVGILWYFSPVPVLAPCFPFAAMAAFQSQQQREKLGNELPKRFQKIRNYPRHADMSIIDLFKQGHNSRVSFLQVLSRSGGRLSWGKASEWTRTYLAFDGFLWSAQAVRSVFFSMNNQAIKDCQPTAAHLQLKDLGHVLALVRCH